MRIFVSYQALDGAIAKAVADGVNAHRPEADLFFAPETLSAGAYWLPRLAKEIEKCHAVLLLIGKRIGKWQELEYLEAVRDARDGEAADYSCWLDGDTHEARKQS